MLSREYRDQANLLEETDQAASKIKKSLVAGKDTLQPAEVSPDCAMCSRFPAFIS